MRIVKESEERRNEILDAAEELFAIKGYDKTSTNDILDRVGIARGTLYYHFKSKEEIMDAVIERMGKGIVEKAEAIANNSEMPLMKRLTGTILALHVTPKEGIDTEVMNQIHQPQNALMHQKVMMMILKDITPVISILVREGIDTGIFETKCPDVAVEMILTYGGIAFDDLMVQSDEEEMWRMNGFIYNIERLLGAEENTLRKELPEAVA